MQHVRLGVFAMLQRAIGEVRLQHTLVLGKTLKSNLQSLQGQGLIGWFGQSGCAGNCLIQRMTYGAARAEHGERGRPEAVTKPGRFQLGVTVDGIVDALRAVVEYFAWAPATNALQRLAL